MCETLRAAFEYPENRINFAENRCPYQDLLEYSPPKHRPHNPNHRRTRKVYRQHPRSDRSPEIGKFNVNTHFTAIFYESVVFQNPIKGIVNPYDPHNYDDYYAEEYGGWGSAGGGGGDRRGGPGSQSGGSGGGGGNNGPRGGRGGGGGGGDRGGDRNGYRDQGQSRYGNRGSHSSGRGGAPSIRSVVLLFYNFLWVLINFCRGKCK